MKIAVIKTGGKQYKVSVGQNLKIEKIAGEPGAILKFPTLLVADEDPSAGSGLVKLELGEPGLGERVEGKILEQGRGEKVSVIKFKHKTRYKKNVGHRQPFTKVEITKI